MTLFEGAVWASMLSVAGIALWWKIDGAAQEKALKEAMDTGYQIACSELRPDIEKMTNRLKYLESAVDMDLAAEVAKLRRANAQMSVVIEELTEGDLTQ